MFRFVGILVLAVNLLGLQGCSSPMAIKESTRLSQGVPPSDKLHFVFLNAELTLATVLPVASPGKPYLPLRILEPGVMQQVGTTFARYGVKIIDPVAVSGPAGESLAKFMRDGGARAYPLLVLAPDKVTSISSNMGRTGQVTILAMLLEPVTNRRLWTATVSSSTDFFIPDVHGPMLLDLLAQRMKADGVI